MATLSTVMARCPAWVKARYSESYFIEWINDLLERCSSEPKLFKSTRKEIGVTVDDYSWIDKPADFRSVSKIYDPQNEERVYNFKEINNRIKVTNAMVEEDTDPETVTTFSSQTTLSIKVNISDAVEGQFQNYLLKITAGTYAGNTYIIDASDASSAGTCKLYFKHPLSAAITSAQATAGELISPDFYVIMEYTASFSTISAGTDEIPLDDNYERNLTSAWLNWKVFNEVDPAMDQTLIAESKFNDVMKKCKRDIRSTTGGRTFGRYSPGWDQFRNAHYEEKTYAEEI